ncbi:MAG: tetratricopeptide repeat protein [Thermoleophilia bacterium]|nr:tetratricopeptide repeat protein [Thermoleophilia bacterium]
MNRIADPRSRFTPSLMKHDLLERLFVAREKILARVIDRVEAAATTDERNHTLLVGPRGSGKTHLVSLAYHRVNDLREAGTAVQVSWLPEDPWTIVSYARLLRAIAERLEPALEDPLPDTVADLEALLVRTAERGGPIVVVLENLDQILDALGNDGQQQLRHLLQAHRPFLLIATTTRIDRALSDQAEPFYGFFTTTRLEPFDVDQASAMLAAIAAESDDQRLLDYLRTDEGRTRVRTIAHLAGGQPRIWALLASALSMEGLGELVEMLLTRFDDLTPYYQEQLGRLSPHQRLVVAELAEADRPINVAELASRLELDQRSLGKTLTEMVERGWVAPTQSPLTAKLDRRRTYYELAEPLARISFQIKETRGEPLRLIVEFLKHWFDPADFASPTETAPAEYVLLAVAGQADDPVVAVTRRLRGLPITRAPTIQMLDEIDDALLAFGSGDPEPVLQLPTPVRAALETELGEHGLPFTRSRVHRAAQDEFGDVPHPAMDNWIQRSESWVTSTNPEHRAAPQALLTAWLARSWRFDQAAEALTTLSDLLGPDHPSKLSAENDLATAFASAGRYTDAIPIHKRTLEASERVLGAEHPDTLITRCNLADDYVAAGLLEEAIPIAEQTLSMCMRLLGSDHRDTLRSRNNLAYAYMQVGRVTDAVTLYEETLAARERLLGTEHRDTLASRSNLAHVYSLAGRLGAAVPIAEETLAAYERLFGPEDRSTVITRNNLAVIYKFAGRVEEAVTLYEQALAVAERILGSEHPVTVLVRDNLAIARAETD